MGRGIRILVVDDQPIVCEGIDALARCERDIEVVGYALTLASARSKLRGLRPHVVVMETALGTAAALPWIEGLKRSAIVPAIVIFTAHHQDALIRRATKAGVRGYILKSDPTRVLMQAIRRAAAGEYTFSEALHDRVSVEPTGVILYQASTRVRPELSARQLDVVHSLVEGLTVKQIAIAMSLSGKTVDNHKTKAMAKLGVHNRAELVRVWYEERLWTLSKRRSTGRTAAFGA
jgi:DNA-binding NarL/FixJ family response regulator